jgi:ribonuclease HI
MFTDASNFGWGAHVNEVDLSTKGTKEESKMSINILELKAVLLGVKHFRTRLKNQRVSLFSDNSTLVFYIWKQEGTHSPVLCRMT